MLRRHHHQGRCATLPCLLFWRASPSSCPTQPPTAARTRTRHEGTRPRCRRFGRQRQRVRNDGNGGAAHAGPGTIAEALISGLPILLNGNVPCQEEGNIPYVVDSGCGIFERNPPKIASIIHKWFSDDGRELLRTMARNAKALGRPDALFKIVRDLAHLCEHPQLNTADKWDLHGRRLAPA